MNSGWYENPLGGGTSLHERSEVLAGSSPVVIVGPLLGVIAAPILELAGYFTLLETSSALSSVAALEVFGPPGAMFSSIVLLAAGNASSSAILPLPLMGPIFGWLSHVLPTGPVVRAVIGAASAKRARDVHDQLIREYGFGLALRIRTSPDPERCWFEVTIGEDALTVEPVQVAEMVNSLIRAG